MYSGRNLYNSVWVPKGPFCLGCHQVGVLTRLTGLLLRRKKDTLYLGIVRAESWTFAMYLYNWHSFYFYYYLGSRREGMLLFRRQPHSVTNQPYQMCRSGGNEGGKFKFSSLVCFWGRSCSNVQLWMVRSMEGSSNTLTIHLLLTSYCIPLRDWRWSRKPNRSWMAEISFKSHSG